MSWKSPRNLNIPWLGTLSSLLKNVELPTFHGETLWVVSDYSFENPASDFDVVGLLFLDPGRTGAWNELRNEVRDNVLKDDRRMSWKDLNHDSRRQSAFLPFLRAADQIHGLAITLAFHRHKDFEIAPNDFSELCTALGLSGKMKRGTFQRAFRIGYCTAMLVAGLSSPGQDIHWVSDQDPVFANISIENETISVFAKLLELFSLHKLGQVRYGTTADGDEPLFQEDLAAVPDLMCGASSEMFTSIRREYGNIPDIYAKLPTLTGRSREFLNWYANWPCPLKRYICTFENRVGRPASVGILDPSLLVRSEVL